LSIALSESIRNPIKGKQKINRQTKAYKAQVRQLKKEKKSSHE